MRRTREPEQATQWTCRYCHFGPFPSMLMTAPSHLCHRAGRMVDYVPSWSPERAAEVERPSVRAVRPAA